MADVLEFRILADVAVCSDVQHGQFSGVMLLASSKAKTSGSNLAAVSLEELASQETGYEKEVEDAEAIDTDALQDELDALDFGDDESSVDDDSVDLR